MWGVLSWRRDLYNIKSTVLRCTSSGTWYTPSDVGPPSLSSSGYFHLPNETTQGSGNVVLMSDNLDNRLFVRREKKIQEQILCFLILFYFKITYAFGLLQIYKGNTFSVQKTKKKKITKIRSTTRHIAKYIQGRFGKNNLKIFCVWVEVWTCEGLCTMTFCQATV